MVQLKRLIQRRDLLLGKLISYKGVLRGTIVERGNICGKPNCRCKRKNRPQLHGPYKYLSHRSKTRTNMIFLNNKKMIYASKGVGQYHEIINLIYKISEINFNILRYHYEELSDGVQV